MPATTISCSTQRHVARQCRVAGMRPAAGIGLALGFLILASVYPAAAQSPNGPIAPQPGLVIPKDPPPGQNIRVGVNLVTTPAIARDAKGQLLGDLTQANFRVFDNGTEQKIESFDVGGSQLSVVIVVETSSRVAGLLPAMHRLGPLFTQTVMGDNGDAAVVGYNDEVDTLSDFTSNADAIDKTFTMLQVGTSGTKLYDAMARGVNMLRSRSDERRKVLITIAEAVDSGSEEKLGALLRRAQLSNVTIYAIGLSTASAEIKGEPREKQGVSATPPGTFGLPPMPGTPQTPGTEAARTSTGPNNMDLTALVSLIVQNVNQKVQRPLEVAAMATGGSYQSTGLYDSSVTMALDQISAELHTQYMLSYRPSGTGSGSYHEIKVEVVGRRGVKVRTRPGYYLGSDQG